ncbi:MAG TPA: hypothetical protein VIH40_04905 [Xanthobacteraceae bacterium]
MAEGAESASADAKTSRQPRLRYEDRPEVGETFADSIRSCVFDGQLMRIEFTVARFDDPGPQGIIEGRQVPVCRLVLNRTALADLFNRVGQLGAALTKAGVTIEPPKLAGEPQKDGKARK